MGIVLKELKECRTALKVITKRSMIQPVARLDAVYKETEELVAFIAKSISTAKKILQLNTKSPPYFGCLT